MNGNESEKSPIYRAVNSPILFSDIEESPQKPTASQPLPKTVHSIASLKRRLECNLISENEGILVKRARESLSATTVIPRIETWSADQLLQHLYANRHLLLVDYLAGDGDVKSTNKPVIPIAPLSVRPRNNSKSLLVVHDEQNVQNSDWPDVLQLKGHGICYNRSKMAEIFEYCCCRFAEKYVSDETFSTCALHLCQNRPSRPVASKSSKSKVENLSAEQRISHLIRRKITFKKSDVMQNNFYKNKLHSKTIFLDDKTYQLTNSFRNESNDKTDDLQKDRDNISKQNLLKAVTDILYKYDIKISCVDFNKYAHDLFRVSKYTMLQAKLRDWSYETCLSTAKNYVLDVISGKSVTEILHANVFNETVTCNSASSSSSTTGTNSSSNTSTVTSLDANSSCSSFEKGPPSVLQEIEVNIDDNQQKVRSMNNAIKNFRERVKRKIDFENSETSQIANNIQSLIKSYKVDD